MGQGFRQVLEAFEDDLGRAPRLTELLEILLWGVRTLPADALADARPDEISGFATRPRTQTRDSSVIDELNDNPFVQATDAFNDWWLAGAGEPVTVAELGSAILEALRQVAAALEDPPQVARLTTVTPILRRAKARARVGDLIAVPAGDRDQHLVVLVCRNRFGTALGLISGRYPLRAPTADLHVAATGVAVHSEEKGIATGRWRIVGHNDGLLDHFPAEPEIYHRPQPPFPGMPPVGEFGSAETADGRLRDVTAVEAQAVDLDGNYRQVYTHKHFEEVLADLIARHRP